jgi:phosphonopyruvate decarboxylase
MGGLTSAGRYKDKIDLTYILFDNESNKSTGGQNTYQSHVNYIKIAKSSGLDVVENVITDIENFNSIVNSMKYNSGLNFICVKCGIDDETPRPPIDVIKINKI